MPETQQQKLGYKLKRICDEVERMSNQDVAKLDLTFVQGTILLFLFEKGGTCAQCEVERYLGISHPAVGGILRRMEQKKLIRCAFDAQDKRVKNVYLTPAGKALYPQVVTIRHEADRKLNHVLTEEQSAQLHRLLDLIYDHLFE